MLSHVITSSWAVLVCRIEGFSFENFSFPHDLIPYRPFIPFTAYANGKKQGTRLWPLEDFTANEDWYF